ncbi:hypothetical protein TCON_0906 [Astathelohania contejeani]|uniref:Uncharacterized protein n=1 Tax=Astathelohania contejeani TaxID=164912 RepID=A0ABQ7I0E0_9MICR|nr:hypothetical protein TCON_0906 [Thelohania contejeani]
MNFLQTLSLTLAVNVAYDLWKEYKITEVICNCISIMIKSITIMIIEAYKMTCIMAVHIYKYICLYWIEKSNQIKRQIQCCSNRLMIIIAYIYIFTKKIYKSIFNLINIAKFVLHNYVLCNYDHAISFIGGLYIWLLHFLSFHSYMATTINRRLMNINVCLQISITNLDNHIIESSTLELTENDIERIRTIISEEIVNLKIYDINNNSGDDVDEKVSDTYGELNISGNFNDSSRNKTNDIRDIRTVVNVMYTIDNNRVVKNNDFNVNNRITDDIIIDNDIDNVNSSINNTILNDENNNHAPPILVNHDIEGDNMTNENTNIEQRTPVDNVDTDFNNSALNNDNIDSVDLGNISNVVITENTIVDSIDTETNNFSAGDSIITISNVNLLFTEDAILVEKKEFEKLFRLNDDIIPCDYIFKEPVYEEPENTVSDDQQFPPEISRRGLARYRKQKTYMKIRWKQLKKY